MADKERLVEELIRHGLHLVKFEELEAAYQTARIRYSNPRYVNLIAPKEVIDKCQVILG